MNDLYDKLVEKKESLSLLGLGYVGMPIAVAFAKKINVIGYDLNEAKINLYKSGVDPTNEVGDEAIRVCQQGVCRFDSFDIRSIYFGAACSIE